MSCALLGPPEELNEEIDIKTLPDLQKEGTQVNGIQDEWFGIKYKTLCLRILPVILHDPLRHPKRSATSS
jgi:hypothetical protein